MAINKERFMFSITISLLILQLWHTIQMLVQNVKSQLMILGLNDFLFLFYLNVSLKNTLYIRATMW